MATDSSLPVIIRFDTTANRMAFTPTPPVPEELYIWLDSDDQPNSYYWDGAAWQAFASGGGGSGDVVGPGSSTDDDIVLFDGATGKLIKDSGVTIADILAMIPAAGITQLTGDVTAGPGSGSQVATIPNNTIVTAKILNANVTYAKIQNVTDARLLGNFSGAPAAPSEYGLGAGLEQSGGLVRTKVAIRTEQIGITVDGGGSVIPIGSYGFKTSPWTGTVIAWRIMADASGDIDFDVTQDPYVSFPPTTSVLTPSLSGVQTDEDTVSLAVTAGDVFGFEVTGTPATITRATLELTIVVTG